MKSELKHIGPILIIGLICLLFAGALYLRNIKAKGSYKPVTPYFQNTANQSFFAYIIENSLGY